VSRDNIVEIFKGAKEQADREAAMHEWVKQGKTVEDLLREFRRICFAELADLSGAGLAESACDQSGRMARRIVSDVRICGRMTAGCCSPGARDFCHNAAMVVSLTVFEAARIGAGLPLSVDLIQSRCARRAAEARGQDVASEGMSCVPGVRHWSLADLRLVAEAGAVAATAALAGVVVIRDMKRELVIRYGQFCGKRIRRRKSCQLSCVRQARSAWR